MGMNSEMKIPGSKKLSLATRELTPSTPMQGRPPHGTSPEEGSFLKVSVRAAHTGNPAALGGGPTQRRLDRQTIHRSVRPGSKGSM